MFVNEILVEVEAIKTIEKCFDYSINLELWAILHIQYPLNFFLQIAIHIYFPYPTFLTNFKVFCIEFNHTCWELFEFREVKFFDEDWSRAYWSVIRLIHYCTYLIDLWFLFANLFHWNFSYYDYKVNMNFPKDKFITASFQY